MADDAARGREPGSLRGSIELCPQRAAGGSSGACVRIHTDRLHQRQVDHEAHVANGVSRYRVPSPADRHEEVSLPGEANGLDDVVRSCTAGDEGRVPIDRAVPDPSRLLISLLARPKQGTPESSAKRLDSLRVDRSVLDGADGSTLPC